MEKRIAAYQEFIVQSIPVKKTDAAGLLNKKQCLMLVDHGERRWLY